MEQLFIFLRENMDLIVFYCLIFNIIALLIITIQGHRITKLNKKCSDLTRNLEGKNIEEIINQYYEKIENVDIRVNNMEIKTSTIEEKLLNSIQRVGVIRFNAFDDTGGELSFSLALLNEKNDGIIMTNIYGRSSSVLYGKIIKKGKSNVTLSAEELQALDRAKSNSLDEYAKMIS